MASYLGIIAKAAAFNCYYAGMSVSTIAEQAGKSCSTIYRWLKICGANKGYREYLLKRDNYEGKTTICDDRRRLRLA